MALDSRTRGPSAGELRWAGLFVAAAFGVFGGVALWRFEALGAARVLWSIGAVFALVYYGVRPLRRPLYALWMRITRPLGWAISHLVLAIIFYGIITPIASVMRLFGWDALRQRFDRDAESYWAAHDPGGDIPRYFRQY